MFISEQMFSRDFHELSLPFRMAALREAGRNINRRVRVVFDTLRSFYSL